MKKVQISALWVFIMCFVIIGCSQSNKKNQNTEEQPLILESSIEPTLELPDKSDFTKTNIIDTKYSGIDISKFGKPIELNNNNYNQKITYPSEERQNNGRNIVYNIPDIEKIIFKGTIGTENFIKSYIINPNTVAIEHIDLPLPKGKKYLNFNEYLYYKNHLLVRALMKDSTLRTFITPCKYKEYSDQQTYREKDDLFNLEYIDLPDNLSIVVGKNTNIYYIDTLDNKDVSIKMTYTNPKLKEIVEYNSELNYIHIKTKDIEELDFENKLVFSAYNHKTKELKNFNIYLYFQHHVSYDYEVMSLFPGADIDIKYTDKNADKVLRSVVNEYANAHKAQKEFKTQEAVKICDEQIKKLKEVLSQKNNEYTKTEASILLSEFVELKHNLILGLDAYGNPPGWVPMLSYELNKSAYQGQIDHVVNTLYLDFLHDNSSTNLNNEIKHLDKIIADLNKTKATCELHARVLKASINRDTTSLHTLKKEKDQHISKLKDIIKNKRKVAEGNVHKRNQFKFFKSVCNLVGTTCLFIPGAEILGVGLLVEAQAFNFCSEMDYQHPFSKENINLLANNLDDFSQELNNINAMLEKNENYKEKREKKEKEKQTKNNKTNTEEECLEINHEALNNATNYLNAASKSLNDISETTDALTSEFSKKKFKKAVNQELQKVLSKDDGYKKELNKFTVCHNKILGIINDITKKNSKYLSKANKAVRLNHTINILNQKVKKDKDALAPEVGIAFHNLKYHALKNLFYYHYLMGKAYEYRVMRPYPKDNINVTQLLKRLETEIITAKGKISPALFQSAKELFYQGIEQVATDILEDVNSTFDINRTECVRYSFTSEQLAELNKGNTLKINFKKIPGLFPIEEENLRIVDITIEACELDNNAKIFNNNRFTPNLEENGSDYIDINFKHSGLSCIQKNGKLYKFIHNPAGSMWENKIDIVGNTISRNTISHEYISLVNNAAENSSISYVPSFTHPSANAVFYVEPQYYSDKEIKKMVIRLKYNKENLHTNFNILELRSNIQDNDIYFEVSKKDINSLKNSASTSFQRTYTRGETLNIKTFKYLNAYEFKYWEEYKNGKWQKIDSKENHLQITMDKNRIIRAYFE